MALFAGCALILRWGTVCAAFAGLTAFAALPAFENLAVELRATVQRDRDQVAAEEPDHG